MQIEEYLKKYQPIIYKTFSNALESGSLSHAYLLHGDSGTPLLNVATHLAKSILCENPSPFACENCIICARIDDGNYPDFIILDGSKGTIKKEAVLSLESNFDKSAMEDKGKKIYILHLVETMSDIVVNSILKFLEEPGVETYAFLTTNNISNVLPTIVSRCQTVSLKLINRQEIIDSSIELGIDKEDAELLSYFYNEPELLKEAFEKDKNYKFAKEAFLDFVDALYKGKDESTFVMQTAVAPLLNSKEAARFFFDLLISFFKDIESRKYNKHIYLTSLDVKIDKLAKDLTRSEEILVEILKSRNQISLNVNITLLLDHVMFIIRKELK